ncbi:MAG: hypothetical protein K0Q87_4882 [Neobacillus sp.]|jgi:hypothetical protein|nr:hypothetical protein [Neobacillus sp.]
MNEDVENFIHEFAKLNLKIVKELQMVTSCDIKPELLKELRESAQVLSYMIKG